MPNKCFVPQCPSVSPTGKMVIKLHSFPKKQCLKAEWVVAIGSTKTVTKHSKVCSLHFEEKFYTITSMGLWKSLDYTKAVPSLNLPKGKCDSGGHVENHQPYHQAATSRPMLALSANCDENIVEKAVTISSEENHHGKNSSTIHGHTATSRPMLALSASCDENIVEKAVTISSEENHHGKNSTSIHDHTASSRLMLAILDENIAEEIVVTSDMEESAMERSTMEESAIEESAKDRILCKAEVDSVQTQTLRSYLTGRNQLISFLILSEKQMKHFCGFNRNQFSAICTFFATCDPVSSLLSIEDEILLTLMKYKLNMFYKTLQMLFDIDERTVSKIFISWTKKIHNKLKTIDWWSTKQKSSNAEYDIIIDCTEIRIEKSEDPIIQQTTYSNYYGTHTFKVLVGCTENGSVIFVSNVYGGAITDRHIFEKCGLLGLLRKGDYVLADRGFDVSDLLESNGIHLNIPPFKRNKQLTEYDVAKTRAIANRRILIENINGLAKTNKILLDRMQHHLWPVAEEIIYNCFMLLCFKQSIVRTG